MAQNQHEADIILAGGGLANGLIARAIAKRRPDLSVTLIEAGETLGGNHTWSFHGSDLDADGHALVSGMIAARWSSQQIQFPNRRRSLSTPYMSISSDRFDHEVRAALARTNGTVMTGQRIGSIDRTGTAVSLADGRTLSAPCVFDGRGWLPHSAEGLALAYQKFVGHEVELAQPHGLTSPILMDATVEQHDGYRFVYVLPLTPKMLLIEDTYYADGPELDTAVLTSRINAYAHAKGWHVTDVKRKEAGVLPIVLSGKIKALQANHGAAPVVGLASGLFHPTTGYSLPDAVRTAQWIAGQDDLRSHTITKKLQHRAAKAWRDRHFYRLLNRLLFVSASGNERRTILEHFYRLPEPLIQRFYAGASTPVDMLRVLTGRPPIPISRALKAVPTAAGHQRVSPGLSRQRP